MTPWSGTAVATLDRTASLEVAVSEDEVSGNVIRLSEDDFAQGKHVRSEFSEDEEAFIRRTTERGKLDAGRTVRSGYAYDFDSTVVVRPVDAERAASIRAELGNKPLHGIEDRYAYRFVKRAFDIVFSVGVITVFSWLYVLIAIAVKVDDPKGPVFFKQRRVGSEGEFTMLKFRSMCVDAEEKLADLKELNEKTGPVFKIADDPRITRVGKWIRKLSLDELPQFFNVLVCMASENMVFPTANVFTVVVRKHLLVAELFLVVKPIGLEQGGKGEIPI